MQNFYLSKTTEPFERGGATLHTEPSDTIDPHRYRTYDTVHKGTIQTPDFPESKQLLDNKPRIDEMKLYKKNGGKTSTGDIEPMPRENSRRRKRKSNSFPTKRACTESKRKKVCVSGRGRRKRVRQRSPASLSCESSSPPPAVDANGLEGLNAYQSLVKGKDQIVCPKFKRIPALLDCDEWDSSDSNEDLNDEMFLRMNLKEEMRQKLYYSRLQDVRQKEEAHRADPSIVVPPRPTGTNAVVLSKSQASLEPVIPVGFGRLPTFNYTLPDNPADWRNPSGLIRVLSYGTGPFSSTPQRSSGGKCSTRGSKVSLKSRTCRGNIDNGGIPQAIPHPSEKVVIKFPLESKLSEITISAKLPVRAKFPEEIIANHQDRGECTPKRPKRFLLRLKRRAS